MKFGTGLYDIATADGRKLNRHVIEDRSIMPKPVLLLDAATSSYGALAPTSLESVSGDKHILRAMGSDVGIDMRGMLAAALIPGMGVTAAELQLQENPDGTFFIKTEHGYIGVGQQMPGGNALQLGDKSAAIAFKFNKLG